jgi:tetratricopeptide (TPR) repeat protein
MSTQQRIAGWMLAVAAVGVSALFAVAQARVHGTIKDEQGRLVAGVQITVSLPGVASFKTESKSDDKGAYAVTLIDATRTYTYRFEKEGYQTLEQAFKVPINSNEKRDFQMVTLEAAKMGIGQAGRELTPQEKAVLVFNEGAEAAQQGDNATARTKIGEALALDGNLAAAWTALATLDFGDKQYAAAAEKAEKAIALEAEDPRALRILVESYTELGDTAKAQAASAALIAADPKAGAADQFNQGIREYNEGNMEKAYALFEQSLAGDPAFAKTHYMLGMCHINRGENADAREHFEAFLAMAPNDPDATTAKEMLSYIK